MKLLIIDDNPDQLYSLSISLRTRGISTITAGSGREALSLLAEHVSDIGAILSDYSMPLMNGMQLIENIHEKYGQIPAILMTAYGTHETANDGFEMGFVGYIKKPFTLEELLPEIKRVFMMRVNTDKAKDFYPKMRV